MKMDLQTTDFGTNPAAGSSSISASPPFSQVLVIIDPREDCASIMKALSDTSEDTDFIFSVENAYTKFYSTFYDLLLCDLSLPGALDFISNVSAMRSNLPVIAIADPSQLEDAVAKIPTADLAWVIRNGGDLRSQVSAATAIVVKRSRKLNAEISIHTERNAYWAATNCAPEGVAILGEDGTIVFANERFNRFVNQVQSDTTCTNVIDLLRLNNAPVAETLLAQLTAAPLGSVWQSEIQVVCQEESDSSMFYEITLSVSDISSASGVIGTYLADSNLRRRVLWLKDITVQKQQEQFLRDLVSTTSHDLKGPLGAISNAAEMLSETEEIEPDTFKILVNAIYSCSRKSIKVIDELLKCPSIKVSDLRLTKVSLPLSGIIGDLIGDFGPTAMAKEIKVISGLIDPNIEVSVDKIAIERVFGNLMSNALKFSRAAGTVEISVRNDSPKYVAISFKDSGPGIEAGEMGQLFQRFGRLKRTKSVEGTGLGLFTVKNIIDAHQGRIEVESELGVGATFTVFLPK